MNEWFIATFKGNATNCGLAVVACLTILLIFAIDWKSSKRTPR